MAIALIFAIGLVSGFVGAMTGVGGAILAVPLLLTLPQWAGLPPISVHATTGLAMVQGLTTNLLGTIVHRRAGFVSGFLLRWVGLSTVIGSLIGSIASRWFPSRWLLSLLGIVLLFCAFQMLRPTPEANRETEFKPNSPIRFAFPGFLTGLLSGATGLGTGSLTIVLLVHYLRVPVRLAIGSTLGISLMAALAGTLGKAITWQLPFAEAVSLSLGAAMGAIGGSKVSHRVPAKTLRHVLAAFIVFAAVHALWRCWH